jgi:hypothetical protein
MHISQQLLMFALFSFFLSNFHCHALIGPVIPGQSVWSISQKIAAATDTIETKIDTLEQDLAIVASGNETLQSKIDSLVTRDFANRELKTDDKSTCDNHPVMHDENTTSHQSIKLQCVNLGNGKIVVNINSNPNNQLQYEVTPATAKKYKPLAVLKIIGGATLAIGCLACGILIGATATVAGISEEEDAYLTIGSIFVGTSLIPLIYFGYKIAKSGLHDLKQIQQSNNKTNNIKKCIRTLYESNSHTITNTHRRLHSNE